jgi:peptide/nickel transport system substrate-binding protein
MMNRVIGALAAVLLASCASTVFAKTLRYSSAEDMQTLDPHSSNLQANNRIHPSFYESLVFRDRDWKVVPWLATSWSQPNPKVWRFKLREGVKFHDGSPFTADDVVFSVERALHPLSQMKASLQGVDKAVKIDNFTVDLQMKEPNPVLPLQLFTFRIMNKAWAEKNKATVPQDYKAREETFASRNANGTGPFRIVSRDPEIKTVLERNPNWWGKWEGNLTRVEVIPIKSNATRMAALQSNEIDFVIDPPPQDVRRVKEQGALKVMEGAEARVQYLGLDVFSDELAYSNVKGKNPLKDVRVRQAMAHAIDIEAIRDKVMRGLAVPIGTTITPTVNGYSKAADKRYAYDPERAKKLLAEAGYANGFEIALDCSTNTPAPEVCQALAPMFARIGIKAMPKITPFPQYFPKLEKYDSSMFLMSWGSATGDALYTINSLLHSVKVGRGAGEGDFNMGRYSNPKIDELISKIKVEMDMAKRDGLIEQVLMLAQADVPQITLHQPVIPWVMRKNVSAVMTPVNALYFWRASVD